MKKSTRNTIDLYAINAAIIADLQKQQAELRPTIVALGEGEFAGYDHTVSVSLSVRTSISVPIAKALLTAAQIADATVATEVVTIRVES